MSIVFKQGSYQQPQQRSASPGPAFSRQQQQQQQRGKNMSRQQKRDNSPHTNQSNLNVTLLVKKRNRGGSGNRKNHAVQGDAESIIPIISYQNTSERAPQQVNENNRNQRYPQQQQQQREQKQQSQLGSLIQSAKEKAAAFGEKEANGKTGVPGILHVPRNVFQNDASSKRGPKGQQQQQQQQQKANYPPNPTLRPAKPRQTASAPPALAEPAEDGMSGSDPSQSVRKRRQRRKRVMERAEIPKEKEAESGSSSGEEKADAVATVIPSVMQTVHILPLVSPSDSRPSFPRRRSSAPDGNVLQQHAAQMANAPDSAKSTRTVDRLYAGANFQNSPAASNLPIPVFLTRQTPTTSGGATHMSQSHESTSVPNSFFGFPPQNHHNNFMRTPSHEVLRMQLEQSPTPPPRTRDRREPEMFTMEDERDVPRTTDAELRKKSRELLSLLSGAKSSPSSGDASPLRSSQTSPVGFSNDPFADPRTFEFESNSLPRMSHPHAHHHHHPHHQHHVSAPPVPMSVIDSVAKPVAMRPVGGDGRAGMGAPHHQGQQHVGQDHNVLAQISQNLKNMLKINAGGGGH